MSGHELFHRHPGNPILTAGDWPYPANAVFNPAAVRIDETTILWLASRTLGGSLTSPSPGLATGSTTGVSGQSRSWLPTPGSKARCGDSRTRGPCGSKSSTASSLLVRPDGPAGPAVYLATTQDFSSVERHGIVVTPEDKNAAILPSALTGNGFSSIDP